MSSTKNKEILKELWSVVYVIVSLECTPSSPRNHGIKSTMYVCMYAGNTKSNELHWFRYVLST
jgi:hypothetical protein